MGKTRPQMVYVPPYTKVAGGWGERGVKVSGRGRARKGQRCVQVLPLPSHTTISVNRARRRGGTLRGYGPLPSENSRAVPSPVLETPPQSVELLNLAALHDAPALPSAEEPLLRGSRREARVGVLGDPAYLLELSAGVQPEPLGVKLPHQAVAARVSWSPVRIESPT
jgi:hypothetical protein